MFGKNFTLDILLNTILEAKPTTIALGTHHYVQLAESDILAKANPADLASVKFLAPAGAAVPQSCEQKFKDKFPNMIGVLNMYGQTESGVISTGVSSVALGSVYAGCRIKVGASSQLKQNLPLFIFDLFCRPTDREP